MSRLGEFVMRHRWTLRDLGLLLGAIAVTAYILLEVDVFVAPGEFERHNVIEVDEMPILGIVVCLGLMAMVWRKSREVRRATRERLEAQRQLGELAFIDPLTGLPNRRSLLGALGAALGAPPGADSLHAMLLIDLNGFKQINDVYGHGVGDQVLVIVGQRLIGAARDGDLVSRLGGDEFAIIAQHLPGTEAVNTFALRVLASLDAPCMAGGVGHRVGAGLGICVFPFPEANVEEVVRRADVALYRAKAESHSAARFFDEQMDAAVRDRELIDRELRGALGRGEIRPVFQPLVDLSTRKVVGFEAFAHWQHPQLGDVAPERFLPIAEEAGLATDIMESVLSEAFITAKTWPDAAFLSFNVTAGQFRDATFADRILALLGKTGLPAHRLEVEIAESALVRYLDSATATLGRLRDAGVRVALDDFGTGYSSLYHLRNFKLDKIKIDRSFIESMSSERESEEIVAALIGLGLGFGLTITAEGIDGASEASALLTRGCQLGQGDLYGKPASAAETLELLSR